MCLSQNSIQAVTQTDVLITCQNFIGTRRVDKSDRPDCLRQGDESVTGTKSRFPQLHL